MNILVKLNPMIGKIRLEAIRRIFHHFGRHVRKRWGALAAAGLCTLGASAMELLRPWPIKVVFDVIFARKSKTPVEGYGAGLVHKFVGGDGRTDVLLAFTAVSILIIAVLAGLFKFGQAYLTSTVGRKIIAAIRQQLYNHIQRLSMSFHDSHHSGDLLVRLTGDIVLLRELMIESVLFFSENVLVLLGMIGVMFWMDWQLTLVALSIVPVLGLLTLRFSGQIRQASRRQRQKESLVAGVISETISAVAVVQSFAREQYESERFSTQNTASLKADLKASRLEASMNRLVEVVVAAGTCAVLWLGVRKTLAEELTPGDLLVFIAYLASMYKPIRRLAGLTTRVAKATVCGERVVSILETEPEIQDAPDAIAAPAFRGEIGFDAVDFSYATGQQVLHQISFTVKPGQTAALVGASGAGKSTIANMLIRFYDPQRGRVLIDGDDVRHYTLNSLRDQIALVLQEAILFGTTIRDNIAYGKLTATEEEIVAAAQAANAHEFIRALENGYDTVIGERGDTLSGGQRQRIAIARAIIRDAPILILDEPMTGLDVHSEAKVREAIQRLMIGKTCLLITHDLDAVAGADVVLVLEHGRIIERGTHEELMAQSGHYRQLCEFKFGPAGARNIAIGELQSG